VGQAQVGVRELHDKRADFGRLGQFGRVLARHRLGAHPGAHGAGVEQGGADRRVLQLVRPGAHQVFQRRLGRPVGTPEGLGTRHPSAGQEDGPRALGFAHQPLDRADQPPARGQVHRHHPVPGLDIHVADRADAAQDGGGMHQDVQPPEPLVDGQPQLVEPVALGDVHRDEGGALAGAGLDLVVELFQAAGRAGDGDDVRPGVGERERGGAADAAAGSGDEGDPALQGLVGHSEGALLA